MSAFFSAFRHFGGILALESALLRHLNRHLAPSKSAPNRRPKYRYYNIHETHYSPNRVLRMFRGLNLHWKIAPQSVPTNFSPDRLGRRREIRLMLKHAQCARFRREFAYYPIDSSHRLGWDRLEYGKLTDEDPGPLGSPRVAGFSRGFLLNLALFCLC